MKTSRFIDAQNITIFKQAESGSSVSTVARAWHQLRDFLQIARYCSENNIASMLMLDGFLTAIILPSIWLPEIWGYEQVQSEGQNEIERERFTDLVDVPQQRHCDHSNLCGRRLFLGCSRV
ncbi:hypothetical protein LZT27_21985 [Aeromonas veronii]|uniref:hypothetical protein n=1 Tax=Aeromonas veronii TaxID=654 RepID=UPI0011C35B32|nr:hypothetical protein [Aeromonas veronii]MDD1847238.1 hypothetical protein [Aeromonas veronii]